MLGLDGHEIVIVSDIGCSGLFDTCFNTHALHGLHGRALTYATGIKLARPELTVVTIMGDGGLGIGGAHVLASCRKNLDITLLVLNNFNYGMTGGQCSATTPAGADTSSRFLGQLEAPLDICVVAEAAGANWIARMSATDKELSGTIVEAIRYRGFSLMDITGVCPGRFSKRNKHSGRMIEQAFKPRSFIRGRADALPEYGAEYRRLAAIAQKPSPPINIEAAGMSSPARTYAILFLGAAGQRINTAAEVLCLAAMHGGAHTTQKNDYPITVLRGHSISEVIISPQPISFTGIATPDLIIALGQEGINRKKHLFAAIDHRTQIIAADHVELPETPARVSTIPFKTHRISSSHIALASLALMAQTGVPISTDLLSKGIEKRFAAPQRDDAMELLKRCSALKLGRSY